MNQIKDNAKTLGQSDAGALGSKQLAGSTLEKHRHVCAFFRNAEESIASCSRTSRKAWSAARKPIKSSILI